MREFCWKEERGVALQGAIERAEVAERDAKLRLRMVRNREKEEMLRRVMEEKREEEKVRGEMNAARELGLAREKERGEAVAAAAAAVAAQIGRAHV